MLMRSQEQQIIPAMLPEVQGRYFFHYKMDQATWFKVGGPADIVFKPAHLEDLQNFLQKKPSDLDIFCLGAGSNVLVRDAGIRGCVLRLARGFADITIQGTTVIVGAGCLDRTLVMRCLQEGLSGLEFLIGIPGTIGGAIAMNAGAYGSEVKDYLAWIELMDRKGKIHRLGPEDLSMSYRSGNLPEGMTVIRAAFQIERKKPEDIQALTEEYLKQREASQPIRGRTGGSTFKNPAQSVRKAWELIDQAGCRGLRIGDAQISEKHCNFLINLNGATAKDLETLGETVQQKVFEKSNTLLEWEIIRLGS